MSSIANTQQEWINANKNYYNWYYSTYPFLINVGLPVSFQTLKDFYKYDYDNRNLKVIPAMLESYELLFSYFLENYTKQNDSTRIKGKTSLEYFINAIPEGFSKTFSDAKNSVSSIFSNISNTAIIILALVAVILFMYKK